ncbi:hypothetical protein L6164_037058 [Bauhinia variegata]|uniref:Uncharacterized protein n=1 Tax=Bauhinia variegata TaxID=167791 RepID=A0ACB9KJ15_BAUVA|nr:hypothetical protein L6164_037058 [Bauhinia variegata]
MRSSISLLCLLLLSLLLLSLLRESSDSTWKPFEDCLLKHQDPKFPLIYFRNLTSHRDPPFSSVLNAYVRNLRFNSSTALKPSIIITARHESHVKAAVICGATNKIQMKIRSGGHDYEGSSYRVDNNYTNPNVQFFILDMFNLRDIEINLTAKTARVQTGATLGELYYKIATTSQTLGFPAGTCPSVGVGGHIGGGGFGNMIRKYGLSSDNVVDAGIIVANGTLLNRTSMGEDLFWAIRGGGAASFGVVLSYTVKLVPVPEIVTTFKVVKTLEENVTNLAFKWQDVAPNITEDLFLKLNLDVENTEREGKTIRASFEGLFLGTCHRLVKILSDRFPELGLKESNCNEMSWAQSLVGIDKPIEALLSRSFSASYFKGKSDYVEKPISKVGFDGIWNKMIKLKDVKLYFYPYGGKMFTIPASETPFPHRDKILWKIQYGINWKKPDEEKASLDKSMEIYDYMAQFVSEDRRSFFPYRDHTLGININYTYEEGRKYGLKYFGDNFYRLVEIKSKVDAANFFKNEQSIPVKNRHGDFDELISLVTEKKGKRGRKLIV